MSCEDTKEVIHAYLDGELDVVRSLAVEQHLKDCPVCAQAHRERQALRTAIGSGSLYFDAPKGLEARVRSAIRQASKAKAPAGAKPQRWPWNWNWPSLLAPLAAAALVLLIAMPLATRYSAQDRLTEEIVSAHVRSMMADHKTDVASSDQHTVKPWLDARLDFAAPVVNFADQGFPLIGGRLDYVNGRQAAALVYKRHEHVINLLIWPSSSKSNSTEKVSVVRGWNLIQWDQGGMTFWAVSDLNRKELTDFAQLIK